MQTTDTACIMDTTFASSRKQTSVYNRFNHLKYNELKTKLMSAVCTKTPMISI